jgi:cytochrome c peroxidase
MHRIRLAVVILVVATAAPWLGRGAPLAGTAPESAVATEAAQSIAAEPYDWRLPHWMPPPPVPADNPMTAAKVELGRHLFFDSRLSGPSYLTCGHCHHAEHGFTDFRPFSFGMSGQTHPRNTPGLANIGYLAPLGWVDPNLHDLEAQVLVPLFNTEPVEMMARGMVVEIEKRLAADRHIRDQFRAAFPETGGRIDLPAIQRALAAFQRSLVAFDTPFDRYRYQGDPTALEPRAALGLARFEDPALGCSLCHVPPLFTDAVAPGFFAGTGLGAPDPRQWRHRRAALAAGHERITDRAGRLVRTPPLRNLEVTAPYMHDARFATLEDLLADYRLDAEGTRLAEADQAALLAFLLALTDKAFLTDPAHRSPYRGPEARAGDPPPPTLH